MTRANPKMVGGFIIGGVVLGLVAVALLASGKYFTKSTRLVSVFPESVRGLQIGSPVTFRGVPLGQVTGIEAFMVRKGGGVDIAVTYEIDLSRIHDPTGVVRKLQASPTREAVADLARKGLRAELLSTSLVTGQLYIDLDFYPDIPPRMEEIEFPVPQVPTAPNKMSVLSQRVERLAASLADLPLEQLLKDVSDTLAAYRDLARAPEIRAAIASAGTAGKDVSRTLHEVDRLVAQVRAKVGEADVAQVVRDLHGTLEAAQKGLEQISETLAGTAGAQREFSHTLAEVARAAAAIRVLADYLERNPSSILQGKPAQSP